MNIQSKVRSAIWRSLATSGIQVQSIPQAELTALLNAVVAGIIAAMEESAITTTKPKGGDIAMRLADEIREFAYKNYIRPARERGEKQITIRAGDVHKEMGLVSRTAAVCAALGTNKFQDMCGIELIGREGPTGSPTLYLTFKLD